MTVVLVLTKTKHNEIMSIRGPSLGGAALSCERDDVQWVQFPLEEDGLLYFQFLLCGNNGLY